MSVVDEKVRSLKNTREFLKWILADANSRTKITEIKDQASYCLKHYPINSTMSSFIDDMAREIEQWREEAAIQARRLADEVREVERLEKEVAELKAQTGTPSILSILKEYRCTHQIDEDGSGAMLVDVLSPSGAATIEKGRLELEGLADFIAGEILPTPPESEATTDEL